MSQFLTAETYVMLTVGVQDCQRGAPVEKVQLSQPTSVVDHVAQQAVDAIKTPMDKARGVEGIPGKFAEQKAEEINKATQ